MTLFTSVAIYVTIWWTVLFAILPIDITSHSDAGVKINDGGDPSAPIDTKLVKKAITTSWVSALVFGLIWLCVTFQWVHLPNLPFS